MAESDSDCSSLSSMTDDESIHDSDDYLSSEESDADCSTSLTEDAEVLPYLFEPEASPESIAGDSHAEIEADREEETSSHIHNTNWCTCGHFSAMNSEKESICCQEIAEMVQLLDEGDVRPECITEHQDFSNICLCRAVLTVALYSHRHRYGTGDIPTDANRRFRYLAYRQLVWWGWQYLGRHRCVVLPSCAASKVRSEFPSEEYTGYQDPPATP